MRLSEQLMEAADEEPKLEGEWANIKPGTVLTVRRMPIYASSAPSSRERVSKKVVKSVRVSKEYGASGSVFLGIRFKRGGKSRSGIERLYKMLKGRRGGYTLNSYEKPPLKYEVEAIDGVAV
jgi:hypothetical protein